MSDTPPPTTSSAAEPLWETSGPVWPDARISEAQAALAQRLDEAWQSVTRVDCACGELGCKKYVRLEPSQDDEAPTLWYLAPDGYEDMMYLPAGKWELRHASVGSEGD